MDLERYRRRRVERGRQSMQRALGVRPSGINFASNDYLGFAENPSIDVPPLPGGAGASALVTGWTPAHRYLASLLADFESAPAAVVFPSGYAACSGVVATLGEAGDAILSDQLNHASLIDGCRLAPADVTVYPHRDVEFIERWMRHHRTRFDRVWVVTDGVFSMDGVLAPVAALADVIRRFDADLIIDEAHATGVIGPHGRGVAQAAGLADAVTVRIGTLSKAVGAQGGFAVGPEAIVDELINACRPLIFSTALCPAAVAAATASLTEMIHDPTRRQRLRRHVIRVRRELSLPAEDAISADVPILPIVRGDAADVVEASHRLAAEGLIVPAIRPPTVPPGTSRLRVTLSAAHDDEQVDRLIDAVRRL